MKNSDRKFQLLSAVLITLFCCILLINSNYVLVESQTSPTFLTLAGSNFLDIDNSERLQLKDFTLSTWFRTDKQDYLEPGTIVNKGGMGTDEEGMNLNYGIWINENNALTGGFEAESGDDFLVNSSKNYNDGNWHYSVLTFNGSSLLLFVDGKLVGNQSAITDKPDNTGDQPLRIGANSLNEDKFFKGDVDEIRVWDRALNESEARGTRSRRARVRPRDPRCLLPRARPLPAGPLTAGPGARPPTS